MGLKLFKFFFYFLLISLIIFFFTRNINLFGNHFYKNIKKVKNPNSIDVLVNKNHQLDKNYIPNDLVKLSLICANEDKFLRQEAALNFEEMCLEARKQGYKIIAVSSYRSYFYQEELYNYYVRTLGEKKALEASAKPGHSEHQTGLVIDIEGSIGKYSDFETTEEFIWMKENAYKYGFILRYPKNKKNITGFKYEPWHYRYVGKDVAKIIHENNITLEEYHKRLKF